MFFQNTILKRTWPMIIQAAEAHRKPRWLPVAKSKIYRIPKRPVISEEERLELLRLNNNYNTQIRAIRRFYHEEMIREKSSRQSASSEMSQRLEAEEWVRCVELNDKWNLTVAKEREERLKIKSEALEKYVLKRKQAENIKLQKEIDKASAKIRREKELSPTFITAEKLDAAIEHALANPTDYNYAIDLKGNMYQGRDIQINPPKDYKAETNSA